MKSRRGATSDPMSSSKTVEATSASCTRTRRRVRPARSIVVVASWFWLANEKLAQVPANDEFVRRASAWLVGKKREITPPPRLPPPHATDLRPEEYDAIAKYTVAYLPLAAALIALIVWLARRA